MATDTVDRTTFSVSTPLDKQPGIQWLIAKKLNLAVVSVIRSDLTNYSILLEEAVLKLPEKSRRSLEDASKLLAHSSIIRMEGLQEATKSEAVSFLTSTGSTALAKFVETLDTATLAAMISRARMLAAFPTTNGTPATVTFTANR